MKRLLALLASTTLLAAPLTVLTAGSAQADHTVESATNFVCNGTYDHRTFRGNVVVPSGATCVITNSTILGNLRNQGNSAPAVVRIINTDVRRNIHLRNVTGSVTIGTADCRIDPEVGNNLMVTGSANVAICKMSVGNNLVLRGNTGRLMARHNLACNNIRVVRNNVEGLRVFKNRYVVNFTLADNQVANVRKVFGNTEKAGTPGACRKTVRAAIG